MAEYERDFSRLVELIPFVVRGKYHKAQMFAEWLKSNIQILITSDGVMTFDECLDQALIIQNNMEKARIERNASEKKEGKKCPPPNRVAVLSLVEATKTFSYSAVD